MAATILHSKNITIADGVHSNYLQPSNWNENHVISGVVLSVNSQAPDGSGNVNVTGGGGGDVTGPASAVGNNFAAFNSTSGKIIQDSGYNAASFAPDYHAHQAGIEGEPVITDNGDGSITVAADSAWFFTDTTREDLVFKTISSGSLSMATTETTYVCADRDTAAWVMLTDITAIDYNQYIPYVIVYRGSSTNLHFQKVPLETHGEVENHHERVMNCERYARESGMEQISVASGTQLLTVDGGVIWAVNRRYTISPVTSANSKWFFNYHSSGVWASSYHANNATINNSQYDDGTNLGSLGGSQWVINYIYRGIEDQDHVYTLLSNAFDSAESAKASNIIGSLPELITSHAILLGRVIVQSGSDVDPANVESAFIASWGSATPVTNHEDLSGLVGGDTNGHYHINSYQYSAVSQIVSTGATNSYMAKNGTFYSLAPGVGTGFSGTNATGTLNSNGLNISVAAPTVITGLATAVTASGTNVTLTHNSGGISIQGAVGTGFSGTNVSGTINATGIALSVAVGGGNYLSTNASSAFAGTGFTATNATGTLGTNGLSLQIAAQTGNFLSTNASSAFAGTGFTATNATGTLGTNGLSLQIAAQTGNFLSTNASTAFAGVGTSATNASITVNTAGLAISVAAPVATTGLAAASTFTGTNITGTVNSAGWSLSAAAPTPFNASTNVAYSTGLATSNAITGTINSTTWNIGVNTSANGFTHTHTYQPAGNYISTGATSGYGTNLATQSVSTGASSHVLFGDGRWASVAGGGSVTNNYSGVLGVGLSAATTNIATGGSVYYHGDNITIGLTTGAGGSHTMNFSAATAAGGAVSFNGTATNAWNLDVANGLAETLAASGQTLGLSSNYTAASNVIASGASNSFLAGNGTYYSVAGGGAVTLGAIDYPWHWKLATSGSTLIATQVHIKHLELQNNVRVSAIDLPLVFACGSTTSGTQSVTVNASAVLYTMNAGTLSPFNAAVFTTGTTFTSNATGTVVGNRMLHMPLATSTILTPQDYWLGYQIQLAGWSSTVVTNIIASGSVPSLFLEFGGLSVTTTAKGGIAEIQGMIASSMSATTNTWNSNVINMGAASWYRANIPVLLRNDPY